MEPTKKIKIEKINNSSSISISEEEEEDNIADLF